MRLGSVSRAFYGAQSLELDDDDAILGFAAAYGPMNVTADGLVRGFDPFVEPVVHDFGLISYSPDSSLPDSSFSVDEALVDFRAAVGAIRALTLLRSQLEDWVSIAALRKDWPAEAPWEAPVNKSAAVGLLGWAVEEVFKYVAIDVQTDGPEGLLVGILRPRWCLYARCVLELLSAMTEGHPVRRCARDDCPNWFSEQDRSTKTAKRRSDTIYCSVRCGRLVAAREYRRRQREIRLQEGS